MFDTNKINEKKNYWLNALIVLAFLIISLAYFSPAIWDGRDLFQPDVAGASGTAQDVRDYETETGEPSYWTNSLFGGMPMYQISPSYPSLKLLSFAQSLYTLHSDDLGVLPSYSWLLFAMLLGFFLFLRSLEVDRWASFLGAVFWAFSSYFIILIDAGHIWKLMTLAFIPPTIAGILWLYRGSYLKGFVLTTFFASLQLMSNHVQMSYYFAFLIVMMIFALMYEAFKEKKQKQFWRATALLSLSAVLAISINLSNLYHTYEYSKETMRGGSALAEQTVGQQTGLDKDYITQWSYGKAETMTLLVPNLYGGSSDYLANKPEVLEKVRPDHRGILAKMNQYWGDQPFTAGPVYVGAFVCFLFILGCFVVRGAMKWALLGGTILSILLSWGHNFMPLTDFFIDYVPLYNKFRTVSSILVVAEFTIPALAILCLIQFLRERMLFVRENMLAIIVSYLLTFGLATLFYIVPSIFFDFLSDQEWVFFRPALNQHGVGEVLESLQNLRAELVSADAYRSMMVIAISFVICILYALNKVKREWCLALLIAISLFDLWQVDKRYLNDDKFIETKKIQAMAKPKTRLDHLIAQDKDPHYRVFNKLVNSFNDATTSANHRSIGGYHAAKLSRYQDLIEHQLAQSKPQALNMLDTRYIIEPNAQGQVRIKTNQDAFGAVWFVERVRLVETASEAMDAFDSSDLKTEAIVEEADCPESLHHYAPSQGQSKITLQSYTPNTCKYQARCTEDRLAVFSEIYYPHGWHLYVDEKEVPIFRVNYCLRAAMIPKGVHDIKMVFAPKSIVYTETIAFIAQIILLLAGLVLLGQSFKAYFNSKKKSQIKKEIYE